MPRRRKSVRSSATCCAAHRDVFLPYAQGSAGGGGAAEAGPPSPCSPASASGAPAPARALLPPVTPVATDAFLATFNEVRAAIALGVYPTRISQGSSGSYFCRDRQGRVVAVFKPKNEEPYGHLNPKWTKWIHKNLFPCCFGRSCLIPNTGFVSEAAASYVDRLLALGCVPRTEVVYLAAPTFHYSRKDRRAAARNVRPLPQKIGSFQLFLDGYQDATTFFRDGHQRLWTAAATAASSMIPATARGYATVPSETSSIVDPQQKQDNPQQRRSSSEEERLPHPLGFTADMQQQFRLGFERLVVLDYIIRNTDRGSDNWMVKVPDGTAAATTAATSTMERVDSAYETNLDKASVTYPPSSPAFTSASRKSSYRDLGDAVPSRSRSRTMTGNGTPASEEVPLSVLPHAQHVNVFSATDFDEFLGAGDSMATAQGQQQQQHGNQQQEQEHLAIPVDAPRKVIDDNHLPDLLVNPESTLHPAPLVEIAAIDNGLAFPHKHPDRVRSYPYGWSFLPLAQVPFSDATADALVPLLESEKTMRKLFHVLEQVMKVDDPFDAKLFEKQKAVIRGQVCNLVEILRRRGTPAELVKRPCVAVYEEIEYVDAAGVGEDAVGEFAGGEGHDDEEDTAALIEDFRLRGDGVQPDLIDRMELIFDDMRDKGKRQYVKIRRRFETLAREPWFTSW